jgi:hypothetical protein
LGSAGGQDGVAGLSYHHLPNGGNPAVCVLTRVRAEVVAATKGRQVPWSNSSLLGEVYLAEK